MCCLVSVVMPAFNGEKFIGKAIESILDQSYSWWELIIVDDASTDRTMDVIDSYSDSRIKVYKNAENKGISYSTNLAISKSNGKYIALLDDDDMATRNRLELQVNYLENNPTIDILGGRSVNIDEKDNILSHDINPPLNNPKYIKAWMHFENRRFSNGTTMIRKEFIENNNLIFCEGYYGIQDFKFMADSSKVGNISSIDRILQFKRIHKMEATNQYINSDYENRKTKYAELQKNSLLDSGFVLTEKQIKTITDYLPEDSSRPLSDDEIKELLDVFDSLRSQAIDMNIDYLNELQIVLKNIIIDKYLKKKRYDFLAELIRNH